MNSESACWRGKRLRSTSKATAATLAAMAARQKVMKAGEKAFQRDMSRGQGCAEDDDADEADRQACQRMGGRRAGGAN